MLSHNSDNSDKIELSEVTIPTSNFKLVSYNRSKVDYREVDTWGILRSVLFAENGKMVCFSPSKSHDIDLFQGAHPSIKDICVEEFVDGTMVNLFWDKQNKTGGGDGSWELMTRKNVGAHNTYYRYSNSCKQRSFRDMFGDAKTACGLQYDRLDKECVYSFVLQHPDNRIITPITTPKLYLVEAYRITDNIDVLGTGTDTRYSIEVLQRSRLKESDMFRETEVLEPAAFTFNSYNELQESISRHSTDSTDSLRKGYILRDPLTNVRAKMVMDEYTFVKDLKANISDMRFLYLSLRRRHCMHTYLHYFPEHKTLFAEYCHLLQDFTHFLYMMYCDCYIKKIKPLREYHSNIRTHMYNLHDTYKLTHRPNGTKLTMSNTVVYVNNMDVPLLFASVFTTM
jgi:hypothetical protein